MGFLKGTIIGADERSRHGKLKHTPIIYVCTYWGYKYLKHVQTQTE
jgi:hypothetical protein